MSEASGKQVESWINGQPEKRLFVSDRGLAYGDGVFETVLVTQKGPLLLQEHLQRLYTGLSRLGIGCDQETLEKSIQLYPGWQHPGVVKIIVTRGSGGRGYNPHQALQPQIIVSHHPVPLYPFQNQQKGVNVFLCQTRLGCNSVLAGVKHLNRLEQVLARQEWQDDYYQEGLMCDQNGRLIEGVMSNVFLVKKGKVMTPVLDQCGVAGIMRDWLMKRFSEHGMPVLECEVFMTDLSQVDEVFFCNSVFGIWPIRQCGVHNWPLGSITQQAQQWVTEQCFG